MAEPERVLIIRLGALGDIVLCMQAFQDIRRAHPAARIALQVKPAFAGFARLMPWFDEILLDERPPLREPGKWLDLLQRVRAFAPTRVYDLQGMTRQSIQYALLGGPFFSEWSGAAPLCSHPRPWPPEPHMHFCDFIAAQLRRAGVPASGPVDLSWLDAPLNGLPVPERFAVFVPGCGPGRDYKRWPPDAFADIAGRLETEGIATLAVGTGADIDAVKALCALAPNVLDLTNRTSLPQLAALARRAAYVLGNDSGPTHLMAAVGAPTLSLICERVNPAWSGPRGPRAGWKQGNPLSALSADEVFLALKALMDKNV